MNPQKKILKSGAGWLLIVREHPSEYEKSIVGSAKCAEDIHRLVRDRIGRELVEVMYVVALDGRHRVIGLFEVARGGLHGCAVSARDILRAALAAGASSFVLVHNHPSGNPTPSPEDVQMTTLVARAASHVDVPLVDHVIVGGWDRFASFRDLGCLNGPS